MTRRPAGLSSAVQDGDWPRPAGWARPERLERGVDSLPGVASALTRRLRALGLVRVVDLLFVRPRRYEAGAVEVAIAQLGRVEEGAVSGVVDDGLRSRR